MRQISLGSAVILSVLVLHTAGSLGCTNQPLHSSMQSAQPTRLHQQTERSGLQVWRRPNERSLATVHCAGGLQCRFTVLNEMRLLDDASGSPTEAAQKAAVFRYESMGQQSHALYHLAVAEGLHEVRLQFYPVTLERAEQFTLIHQFKSGHDYLLHLFRDRQNQPTSLLAMAAPDPLCVDLSENKRVVRRFCRPFDPETGLGEFIETKLPQSAG